MAKMVGTELTALFVWCGRMQRPKSRGRGGRGGWRKNTKRPSWHEMWAVDDDDDDDEHVALDNQNGVQRAQGMAWSEVKRVDSWANG